MVQRKRATRSAPTSNTLSIAVPKPRNSVLQAAALGQVKLGTAKHEKSAGALRRAQKMAVQKAAKNQTEN
ncbi:hypothetical protein [Variovorax sp. PCZ-1]|uniref:hypothetical protein n=1 Tax=Variovorax sp. PCZ-1 TaxID=2835533 RepID=UPI001BD050B0|nr:hypothetical protein [Variovorax sp. PCZ-1]MBS7807356.1 hypothetical protein [Variovorax sp. PCZ-1]